MQDQRSFSCPNSSETSTASGYIVEGTPTFARVSYADLNPMLLLRPPDTDVGIFQGEVDDPNSYSPLFQGVESDDLFNNAVQPRDLNGDIPGDDNRQLCTDNTCVQIENGSTAKSTSNLDIVDNPRTSSLDDIETQRDEKPRSANRQERLRERQVRENGYDSNSGFERRASLRGSRAGAGEKSFNSVRRFDSLRLPRDPTADLQPITDPVLLQKLKDTTGLQSSELKLSQKVKCHQSINCV